MTPLRTFFARISGLFGTKRRDLELDAEVRAHLYLLAESYERRGMSPAEARLAAKKEFGGIEQTKQLYREQRGLPMLETFVNDLRYALRMLRKNPGFTVVAVLTVALGIGACTAIFSVVNSVVLRPLPYPRPDGLVAVYQTLPSRGVFQNGVSYPNYVDWRHQVRSLEDVVAMRTSTFTLNGRGDPFYITAAMVTSNLFPMLRVKPLLGRTLIADDDAATANPVVVLSERLWKNRFGGDPALVGKAISLDQHPFTVVGVVSREFSFPLENPPMDLWASLVQDPIFRDLHELRGGHYLAIVGRLKEGVRIAQAEAELQTIQASLNKQFPRENEGWSARVVSLQESLVGNVRTALLVLLGAVGLVFFIACANVANLLLARASARSREVAIRSALGAGYGRLARQFFTECLVLGLFGGGLGLALAYAGITGLRDWLPSDLPRVNEIAVDYRVLLFTLLVSLCGVMIFGLAPAFHASGINLSEILKEGALGSGESAGKRRLRNLLVVVETALSFVLLIGAGLLGRSFLHLQQVQPGFNASHVLTAAVSLPRSQYAKPEQWSNFYTQVIQGLKAQSGVESVAASLPLPLAGTGLNFGFEIEGRSASGSGNDQNANYSAISPEYFHVLAIPLIKGRLFTVADVASAPKVCLVSSTFVRQFFPNEDPLGKRLIFGYGASVAREIVGVVADVKRDGLAEPSHPELYVPFVQDPWWTAYIAIRTPGDPENVASILREQVRGLDPTLPVADVQPMTVIVKDSVAQPRFRTTLLGFFGAAALLLAIVGIYGVVSYNVEQRTREIGIRLALGAQRGDVLRIVLRQGTTLAALGLAAGLAGAIVLTRYLSSLLFEVTVGDPVIFTGVAIVLMSAALFACYVPARRAMRVDPIVALRYE